MTVKLGTREVGTGRPGYVIADAGADADAVKFQTYSGRTPHSTKTPRFDDDILTWEML